MRDDILNTFGYEEWDEEEGVRHFPVWEDTRVCVCGTDLRMMMDGRMGSDRMGGWVAVLRFDG